MISLSDNNLKQLHTMKWLLIFVLAAILLYPQHRYSDLFIIREKQLYRKEKM